MKLGWTGGWLVLGWWASAGELETRKSSGRNNQWACSIQEKRLGCVKETHDDWYREPRNWHTEPPSEQLSVMQEQQAEVAAESSSQRSKQASKDAHTHTHARTHSTQHRLRPVRLHIHPLPPILVTQADDGRRGPRTATPST